MQKTAYIFAISEIRMGFESALYRPTLSSNEQVCTETFLTITLILKLALLAPAICRPIHVRGRGGWRKTIESMRRSGDPGGFLRQRIALFGRPGFCYKCVRSARKE